MPCMNLLSIFVDNDSLSKTLFLRRWSSSAVNKDKQKRIMVELDGQEQLLCDKIAAETEFR